MNKVRTNITLDPFLKKESAKLFTKLGLDFSTAVSIFLKQAIEEQGLPFEVKLHEPNRSTKQAIKELDAHSKGKKTKVRVYNTPKEMFKDLGI